MSVEKLLVEGDVRVSGAIRAVSSLNDVVLEDARQHATPTRRPGCQGRIVRLLETRKTADGAAAEKELYMIKVKYRADSEAEKETVEVSINSFTVVASISYLLEISTFFIPEQVYT